MLFSRPTARLRPGLSRAGKPAMVLRLRPKSTSPMDCRNGLCTAEAGRCLLRTLPASPRCPTQPGHGPGKQRLKFLSSDWRSRSRRGSTRSASRSLSPTARTPRCSRRHRRSLRCARAHRDDPGTECARGLRCSRRGLRGPHHRGPAPLESHHRTRPHDGVRPDRDGLTQPARRDRAAARQRNPEGADPHQSAGARGALRALRSIPPECRVVKGWAAV